jgi:hypothetical protein
VSSNSDDFLHQTILDAHDAGATVSVLVRNQPGHRFTGLVQNVAGDAFALYHSGEEMGWRWIFRFADVVTVGVLTPGPTTAQLALPCPHLDP